MLMLTILALDMSWRIKHHVVHVVMVVMVVAHIRVVIQSSNALFTLFINLIALSSLIKATHSSHFIIEWLIIISLTSILFHVILLIVHSPPDGVILLLRAKTCPESLLAQMI